MFRLQFRLCLLDCFLVDIIKALKIFAHFWWQNGVVQLSYFCVSWLQIKTFSFFLLRIFGGKYTLFSSNFVVCARTRVEANQESVLQKHSHGQKGTSKSWVNYKEYSRFHTNLFMYFVCDAIWCGKTMRHSIAFRPNSFFPESFDPVWQMKQIHKRQRRPYCSGNEANQIWLCLGGYRQKRIFPNTCLYEYCEYVQINVFFLAAAQ